jgi:hypothetical protein
MSVYQKMPEPNQIICDCPLCPIEEYFKTIGENHICCWFNLDFNSDGMGIAIPLNLNKSITDNNIIIQSALLVRFMNNDGDIGRLRVKHSHNTSIKNINLSLHYFSNRNNTKLYKLCVYK